MHAGTEPPEDQARFDRHPMVARDLLASIPRLESIAWIIGQQGGDDGEIRAGSDAETSEINTAAQLLRAASLFDRIRKTSSPEDVILKLEAAMKGCHPAITKAFRGFAVPTQAAAVRLCSLGELQAGMTLDQEVRSRQGIVFGAIGQEITLPLLLRLRGLGKKDGLSETLRVRVRPAT